MLDFSFAEIALIVVVAVIFIGPNELPAVIRMVTKALHGMRSLTKELRATFDDLSREAGLHETAEQINKEIRMIRGDDGNMYQAYNHPVTPTSIREQSNNLEQASLPPTPPPSEAGK